jgi:predicted AAA+ superfamily ATPase
MDYHYRLIESVLKKAELYFPVIVLTGSRQVGKSTLLTHMHPDIEHITFDPVVDVGNARLDPEFFLHNLKTPVILDEIQYAPELLSVIKRLVDNNPKPAQYWLTGSQNLQLLKTVSESLAGRAAVFELWPLTIGEIYQEPKPWFVSFLQNPEAFLQSPLTRFKSIPSLYDIIWRGGYPGLLGIESDIATHALNSYLRTYVERDVRLVAEVTDLQEFSRFVQFLANLTAQEINFSQLGREIGILPQTAQRWLNVLKATYQWTSIQPYFGNSLKRIAGKQKGYFIDTGMVCHLMRITSPGALMGHPSLGALFETLIAQDLMRQMMLMSPAPNVYHWRTHGGAEVDLIFEIDNVFYPVEIKCTFRPQSSDTRGIAAFRETYPHLHIGPGLIIAPTETAFPMKNNCFCIPFDTSIQ